jgi:hypothetical protein
MKNLLRKLSLWQSLLSLGILGIFIVLAVGSLDLELLGLDIKVYTDYQGNGVYKVSEYHQMKDQLKTYTGKRDEYGRWQGKVEIQWLGDNPYTENATFEHGLRQGISTRTYPDQHQVEEHYLNGIKYDLKKAAWGDLTDVSAFQILENKYPWYLFSLNGWGFGDADVKAFTDTLEMVMNTYEFTASEFDTYFDNALSSLEETPFDSILVLNSNLVILNGLDAIKSSELRLAVIDHYRSQNTPTFSIISTKYPNYLHFLNDSGVVNLDVEKFCNDLDDSLAVFGTLNGEDPFFADSVDSRLFTALSSFISLPGSTVRMAKFTNNTTVAKNPQATFTELFRNARTKIRPMLLKSGSSDVAAVVISQMLLEMLEGDMVRKAVREAWLTRHGILSYPVASTVFSRYNSATSVDLQGYVLEDGGAAVTARGIAWAAFYNPTTGDHAIPSESGTGAFVVTLPDLTEGNTYYARTYATNSLGTAYGNCISFVAALPNGIQNREFSRNFDIYPSPASSITSFSFQLGSAEDIRLTIMDMKGGIVLQKDQGRMPAGENHVQLDLSALRSGVYTCQLSNGTQKATCKFVIAH